ncbi:MAG: sugar transferase [Bacteroidota bacterium]
MNTSEQLSSSVSMDHLPGITFFENTYKYKTFDQWVDAEAAAISAKAGYEIITPAILNEIRRINKYLEKVNSELKTGDYLIVKFEPQSARKNRIVSRSGKFFGTIGYYLGDFLFHRVFAKVKWTKKLYFNITKGRNRSISLTEGLGRVISCGFKVLDYVFDESLVYIIAQKEGEPAFNNQVSYGPVVRLSRVGYQGKEVAIYKLRTMRPYAEYVQKFIYDRNGTYDGDKIIDDFRVTKWGTFLRKFWLDELPMLWNFFKGDLKLVGIRPLSKHKFDTYPEHLKALRIQSKPGLVPPYYADLPKTTQAFFDTEERYLRAYFESPWKTDITYFLRACKNIFLRGARSK